MPQTSPCAFLQPTARPISSTPAGPGTLLPGERVGVWRIDELVGGTTYAVTRVDSGLPAVLHEIDAPALIVGSYTETLRAIVERLRPLRHPGITELYDAGTLGDGRPFIVLERLHGLMLALRAIEGRLNTDDAIEILLDIAEPLALAHAAGIVHGGLAPEHVLLVDDDRTRVKLLDWGIERAIAHEARSADRLTWSVQDTATAYGPEDDIRALAGIARAIMHDDIPIELDYLLDEMADEDPRERPTIDQVIERLEDLHLGPALERFEPPPAGCLVAPDEPGTGYDDDPLDIDNGDGNGWRVRIATIATVCIVIAIVIAGIARARGAQPVAVPPPAPAIPVTPKVAPPMEAARPPVVKTSAPAPSRAAPVKPAPVKPAPVKARPRPQRAAPAPSADDVTQVYQRIGHELYVLQQQHGDQATAELWPKFRAIQLDAALVTPAARKAAIEQLAVIHAAAASATPAEP